MDNQNVNVLINKLAQEFKFDVCKVVDPVLPSITSFRLKEFIKLGFHGDMKWIEDTFERRKSPINLWPEAKSAIILGLNYGPISNPLEKIKHKSLGNISVYAQGKDYHDVIKGRLKLFSSKLISKLDKEHETKLKVFVDTAPLMEKPLAQKSGMGWQGKHTNLVSRDFGSWLFLGVILVNKTFQYDTPEVDHCGTCNKCIKICPTDAFDEPNKLDARKCISYLTIENKNFIPKEFRKAMGNRIFGCDDCLAICPWNKYAKTSSEIKFNSSKYNFSLSELLKLNDKEFRLKFKGSPIKRIGRDRFLRNCCIAAGNSCDTKLISDLISLILNDKSSLVRGAAVWAFQELARYN
jgi:epoxyqueuosine reductase